MVEANDNKATGEKRGRGRPRLPSLSDVAYKASIDPGPRQRQQHDGLTLESMPYEDGVGLRVRVNTQRPLDRYAQRGEVTPPQHQAGDQLRMDFERAGLQPRVIMHYAPRLPRSPTEPCDHRMDARQRFYAALDGVGRLGEGVLWHVCCVGESAGDWAHRHGRGVRDGIVLLRAALDELDRYYNPPARPVAGRQPSSGSRVSVDRAAAGRCSPVAAAAAERGPAR